MWITGLAFLTIAAVLLSILSKRFSPLLALFLFPVASSLALGKGWQTGSFVVAGIRDIAPVIGTFVFAILFFGMLRDAGLLDQPIAWLIHHMGSRPSRIVPCSALLALCIHLDGSGAVVFLIAIPALLPIYEQLHIDRRLLACSTSLAAGVNFLPWTGPTLRAAAALHVTPFALFRPLVGVQIVGLVYVLVVSWLLGLREERRLACQGIVYTAELTRNKPVASRTKFVLNMLLALLVLALAISGKVEPAIAFMAGTTLVLLLNFPDLKQQHERLAAHAPAALLMCAILFSAGAFSGIMKGTGMFAAMAAAFGRHVPVASAHHIPFLLGLIAMPLSLVFDPDSFYFGALPILAGVAGAASVPAMQVGQAALLGQMTTGLPISPLTPATLLVVGLSGISLGEHQRFTGPYLFLASVVMTFAAVLFGVISF